MEARTVSDFLFEVFYNGSLHGAQQNLESRLRYDSRQRFSRPSTFAHMRMRRLGRAHRDGWGLAPDRAAAVRWFRIVVRHQPESPWDCLDSISITCVILVRNKGLSQLDEHHMW